MSTDVVKNFVAGGVAGMFSKTSVAPLDRIKILLQAHNSHYKNLGVLSGLRGIVSKEGFIGLYKGNGAMMVRIFPYAAVQFVSFETYKTVFKESALGRYNAHVSKFLAGSAAGVTAVLATYPLDMVRARLAFQVNGQHVYSGILDTVVSICRKEGGILALYRGLSPTLIGMVPYAGINFYVFEQMKAVLLQRLPIIFAQINENNSGGMQLNVPGKLVCGGVAGAIAQTVSYPMDVARRRMQLSLMYTEMNKYNVGLVQALMLTWKEHGVVKGLYRGMSANYFRAVPMVAVSFSTYEVMRQTFGLDTGVN
ncbi:graves disease carrier protein homolog [Galendromus occidentalis]|uniref:Graves disease carrier protein homolog n=1 Tax=Galendromus occidentalis TaxID=34638 RepID=A0AAJ6QTA8_9ACAR|nr:graves disease carrier protein homolog [Galendromus occidentalis]